MSSEAYSSMDGAMDDVQSQSPTRGRVLVPIKSNRQTFLPKRVVNLIKLSRDIGVVLVASLIPVLVISAIVFGAYAVCSEFASWNVQDFKDAMIGYR